MGLVDESVSVGLSEAGRTHYLHFMPSSRSAMEQYSMIVKVYSKFRLMNDYHYQPSKNMDLSLKPFQSSTLDNLFECNEVYQVWGRKGFSSVLMCVVLLKSRTMAWYARFPQSVRMPCGLTSGHGQARRKGCDAGSPQTTPMLCKMGT